MENHMPRLALIIFFLFSLSAHAEVDLKEIRYNCAKARPLGMSQFDCFLETANQLKGLGCNLVSDAGPKEECMATNFFIFSSNCSSKPLGEYYSPETKCKNGSLWVANRSAKKKMTGLEGVCFYRANATSLKKPTKAVR